MPRHLISDAHEWVNVIHSVFICSQGILRPWARAWINRWGKKGHVELDFKLEFVIVLAM